MSREKTFIDEMNCEMIDEMSDSMVDDTKSSRRREYNDLGLTGRPKVANSERHSGGSHLCEEGGAHEVMEQRRSVDYRTVNSDRPQRTVAQGTQRSLQSSKQSTQASGKGFIVLICIILFAVGAAADALPLVVVSILLLVGIFSNKNGKNRK